MTAEDQTLIQILLRLARDYQHKGDLTTAAECYTQIAKLADPDSILALLSIVHAKACLKVIKNDDA